jgi:lambda family phage minor tail protein L
MPYPSLAGTAQAADAGQDVTLFVFDATMLRDRDGNPGPLYRWTHGDINDNPVRFQGHTYTPLPIQADGFAWSARGPLPRPRLRVTNIGNLVGSLMVAFGDLCGARVTRISTFAHYLEGGAWQHSAAMWPLDIYVVDRKVGHDKYMVEWELVSILDLENVTLPGRHCIRDQCPRTYRVWTGTAFDYTRASCPYAGGTFFTLNGDHTADPSKDRCGRHLRDCRLRFGAHGVLPTWAFPGMLRAPPV